MLKIVEMLYSKNKIKEFILAIEIFLMVLILAIALVPITNIVVFSQSIRNAFGRVDDLVYFTPSPTLETNSNDVYLTGNVAPENIEFPEDALVDTYRSNITYGFFFNENGETADQFNLLSYSENTYNRVRFFLSKGDCNETYEGAVSVLISSSLETKYSIGDVFMCKVGPSNKEVKFFVSGILSDNAPILSFSEQSSSNITLKNLGGQLGDLEDRGYVFMVAVQNIDIIDYNDWSPAAVFSIKNVKDINSLVEGLNMNYSAKGSFYLYDSIYKNTLGICINDNEENLLILFLFSIVLVFNCCCYIFINIKRKSRLNAILNICGLSFRYSILLNIFSVVIIVAPSVLIGLILSPNIIIAMGVNFYGYNILMYLTIFLFFIATVIISVIVAFIRKKSTIVIKKYKGA